MSRSINRREFMRESVRAIAGMAAVTVLPGRIASKLTKGRRRMPILSCETYSLNRAIREGKIKFLDVPRILKELDIPGITLNTIYFESWDNEYLDKVKAACAAAGRVITGLIIEGNIATDDEEARERQIADDAAKMRAAAYLGAPIVRINLGGTGSEERDATVGVERVIVAFRRLLPLARETGLKITMENHGGVSKKSEWLIRIMDATDPKIVGACLDTANWPEETRYQEIEKLAPRAYHVHAKAFEFDENGEDKRLDYGRICQIIRASGYDRAVSIEFEGPGDPIEGVRKTRDLLRKHWPGL